MVHKKRIKLVSLSFPRTFNYLHSSLCFYTSVGNDYASANFWNRGTIRGTVTLNIHGCGDADSRFRNANGGTHGGLIIKRTGCEGTLNKFLVPEVGEKLFNAFLQLVLTEKLERIFLWLSFFLIQLSWSYQILITL